MVRFTLNIATMATIIVFTSASPIGTKVVKNNELAASGNKPYTQFNGDGSTADGWPSVSDWIGFDTMFKINAVTMGTSCAQFGQANNSPSEIQDIRKAIEDAANSTKVDKRFVLAVMMQESRGCVRVPTTAATVANPGLMQDHGGSASCNAGSAVQDPCPSSKIAQMIQEGTAGTPAGPGLQQLLQQAGQSASAQSSYIAARLYNSGSVASGGDLGQGSATHCYSSDIANRLTGWALAPNSCTLD